MDAVCKNQSRTEWDNRRISPNWTESHHLEMNSGVFNLAGL